MPRLQHNDTQRRAAFASNRMRALQLDGVQCNMLNCAMNALYAVSMMKKLRQFHESLDRWQLHHSLIALPHAEDAVAESEGSQDAVRLYTWRSATTVPYAWTRCARFGNRS
ncbi:unnamed protein product [Cercospora beticola]|nr:unnamed protein product [Cercospora beticola]